MKKNLLKLAVLAFIAILLSSCLTVEKKMYIFKMTGLNSGKLSIIYINIMSDMDDTLDVSHEDFDELLNSYIYGTEIEDYFPMATNMEKRLFVMENQLWGRVDMEFDNLAAVHLYQHDRKGPYMFCVNTASDTESYIESNGEYGGDHMPVVFWGSKSKELNLTTLIQEPDETTLNLVGHYNKMDNILK